MEIFKFINGDNFYMLILLKYVKNTRGFSHERFKMNKNRDNMRLTIISVC